MTPPAASWRSRPIAKERDTKDLDHAAARYAMRDGDQAKAEERAYGEYVRASHVRAAAHHYRRAAAAQVAHRDDTAAKHLAAYRAHAGKLGIDPAGRPPAEILLSARESELRERGPGFRPHAGDIFARG
jgi:hypothetical protein